MRIVVLPEAVGPVVAQVRQYGGIEGEFIRDATGRIYYRYPGDRQPLLAAPSLDRFREIAAVWNQYQEEVGGFDTEEEQLAVVERMTAELQRLGALDAGPDGYWSILAEQAEDGML